MYMKKSQLIKNWGVLMYRQKTQVIAKKELNWRDLWLGKAESACWKMKGYPGMLMKTKNRFLA
jgi:hypothetical protein